MNLDQVICVGQLTSKFQLTIPKPVRYLLDIEDRDQVIFVLNERGEVVLHRGINFKNDNIAG